MAQKWFNTPTPGARSAQRSAKPSLVTFFGFGKKVTRQSAGTDGFDLIFRKYKQTSRPAGRVPPDALLLSGNKSKQKCLHLAAYRTSNGLAANPPVWPIFQLLFDQ